MSFPEINRKSSKIGKSVTPKPNMPVSKVVHYVEENLVEFSKQCTNSSIRNELGLTEEFCDILNYRADGYPFWFHNESLEDKTKGSSPRIDIAVKTRQKVKINSKTYLHKERFFAFEAKILGVKELYRKQEYLIGKDEHGNPKHCGGIERFKRYKHGQGLDYAGLIGYVLKQDFDFWYNEINSWIDKLIQNNIDNQIKWTVNDKLFRQRNKYSCAAKFTSQNSRIKDGKKIKSIFIYHLWVNLS